MRALIIEPSPTYQRILSWMLDTYDFDMAFVDSATAGFRATRERQRLFWHCSRNAVLLSFS